MIIKTNLTYSKNLILMKKLSLIFLMFVVVSFSNFTKAQNVPSGETLAIHIQDGKPNYVGDENEYSSEDQEGKRAVGKVYSEIEINEIAEAKADSIAKIFEASQKSMKQQLATQDSLLNIKISELNTLQDQIKTFDKTQQDEVKRIEIVEAYVKLEEEILVDAYQQNFIKSLSELRTISHKLQSTQLLDSSRKFFAKLSKIGNAQDYPMFKEWEVAFREFAKRDAKSEQVVKLIDKSLDVVQQCSDKVPVYGDFISLAADGVQLFVNGFNGPRKREMIEKGNQTFALLKSLGRYTDAMNDIDYQWFEMNSELERLDATYTRLLREQLAFVGADFNEFKQKEAIGGSKFDDYLEQVRKQAREKIAHLATNKNNNSWKSKLEKFNTLAQKLKFDLIEIPEKVDQIFMRYEYTIDLLSVDEHIGNQVKELRVPLKDLKNSFSQLFSNAYIEHAFIEYKRP